MRSELRPRKSTSSTSAIEARPAAASVSNYERYRHTAPRRAVGAIVKRVDDAREKIGNTVWIDWTSRRKRAMS
jgi:hypothetical protein